MATETIDEPVAAPSAPPRGVHDMTQGSVRAHLVRMMVFVLAGLVIQTLYGLVDIYWVGRLGKQAVAAVAMSTNLMFVAMALSQMLSVGCVALVSQAAGRKDHAEVQRLFNQAQSLSTFAGVVFLVVCFALRDTYAKELAGDPTTAQLSSSFLTAFIPALGLQFLMVGMAAALRGIGDMRPASSRRRRACSSTWCSRRSSCSAGSRARRRSASSAPRCPRSSRRSRR